MHFDCDELLISRISCPTFSGSGVSRSPTVSPFLHGIYIAQQQQQEDLTPAALSVGEQQVVPGDAQRASGGRVERLAQHHVLHVGGPDVLRELHPRSQIKITSFSLPFNLIF